MTATGLKYHLLTWSEHVACRLADEVFSVSHSVRQIVVDRNLCPAHKVKVLANGSVNGIDAVGKFNPERLDAQFRAQMRAHYRIPNEAVVVGFIGRRVRDKGIVELAEAWRTVRELQPNAYLLVVGPSEPQDPVPEDVEQALVRDPRVRVTGYVDDILTVYAVMDVLTLPTYREGFPISLLEAAALALPVVATRVTGCTDAVIDGVTGTLVPTHDAEGLAQAIAAYLDQPELRTRHGQAARSRVLHEYQPEDILEATYAAFTRLLKAKALPIPPLGQTEYAT
jgi:glycosyltransferase involved in cell wall biosynthesis